MINGVLSDTELLYGEGDNKTTLEVNTSDLHVLQDYINFMNKYDINCLWVHPLSNLSTRFYYCDSAFFENLREKYYKPIHRDISPFIEVKILNKSKNNFLYIILPAYLHEDFPPGVLESKNNFTLYAYANYINHFIQVPFTRDAKGTGIALLESIHKYKHLQLHNVNLNTFYTQKQIDFQWARSLTTKELNYKYFHIIDVNTQYLSVTKGLKVGRGKCYVHDYNYQFDQEKIGLWWINVKNNTILEKKKYPSIFSDKKFYHTEVVAKAIEIGYEIEVLGSYTFEDYWYMFSPWYDILEKALEADKDVFNGMKIMKPFIKRLCNPLIGLMGREKEDGENDKWYNRPDIYNGVVSSCKAELFEHLHQMAQNNISMVYVDVDSIGYLSNKPFEESLPDSIPVSDKIGHFKHSGTYLVKDITDYCTSSIHTLKSRTKELQNNG